MSARPQCTTDGCDRPHHARGLCQPCYYAQWVAANGDRLRAARRSWRERNPDPVRSAEATRAWRRANPEKVRLAKAAYRKANPDAIRRYRTEWKAANPDKVRASKRRHAATRPEKGREYAARRRARRRGNRCEPYDRRTIFARDGWVCQLCDEPIYVALRCPHPMSATVDHVIPIVNGGADAPDNVQAAHKVCNERKGSRTPSADPPVRRTRKVTAR